MKYIEIKNTYYLNSEVRFSSSVIKQQSALEKSFITSFCTIYSAPWNEAETMYVIRWMYAHYILALEINSKKKVSRCLQSNKNVTEEWDRERERSVKIILA